MNGVDDEEKIGRCIRALKTLCDRWKDQPKLRQVVQQAVARIECWFRQVP